MAAPRNASPDLAPLQRVMLRDSLAEEAAGHHVEQLEIRFAAGEWRDRVASSWAETVARTEVLRLSFSIENREPRSMESAWPLPILELRETSPTDWHAWLTDDRHLPLLAPRQAPWRAVYWPHDGRFLWTFHHALLDGRSITRVLRSFLAGVSGGVPKNLALAQWHPPDARSLALAERIFREDFPPLSPEESVPCVADDGPASRILGSVFRERLERRALTLDSTAATLLIWAWGQALAKESGTNAVVVEQVRTGAPQIGTAGFTMLTLPVCIPRVAGGSEEKALRDFRAHLLDLRAIEGVSPADFPTGVYPDVDRPGSSVIMVEHATPEDLPGADFVHSVVLHEAEGETLTATAHLFPDLRLKVEGPGRSVLLDGWLRELELLVR
ncbi:MAG: hypothetical protein ACRCXD_12470 [Luteolibacter sp.]